MDWIAWTAIVPLVIFLCHIHESGVDEDIRERAEKTADEVERRLR